MSARMTDLEELIRRLAGRDARTGRSGDPLDDPSGDVAQLLDEIRRRTRSLLDGAGTADRDPNIDGGIGTTAPRAGPGGVLGGGSGQGGRRSALGWLVLVMLLVATSAITAGVFARLADRAFATRDEGLERRIATELRDQLAARLAQAPAAPPAPGIEALGRVEANLLALRDRIDTVARSLTTHEDRARPPAAEAATAPAAIPAGDAAAPVLSEIAAIRRDVAAAEAAMNRQIQEMRTVLHEVNTVVRRVLSRPQPTANNNLAPLLAVTIQALVNNLQHPSAQIRGEAVEQLLRIGTPARSAVPSLQQQHAREGDQNVRTAIETAISVLSSN